MEYGQFCPIAKATEILGEKWTILIVRELIMAGALDLCVNDPGKPATGE